VPILPVVDIAVLGSPDNDSQQLTDEALRSQELVAHATPFPIADAPEEKWSRGGRRSQAVHNIGWVRDANWLAP
jgi:hypothetical protein